MKKPLVSIVIPVFNGAGFVEETVKSIMKNSYRNFEVILMDDGSTDKSKRLCKQLTKAYKRVRFYSFDRNGGMVRSLNFGIKKAKGKYIARINQDDLMVNKRLKWQVEYLEKNVDMVAVGGYVKLFTKDNSNFAKLLFPLSDKKIRQKWLMFSPFADPAVMFRRGAFLKTQGYSQHFWPADDVHMWYQLGKVGKLANLPKIVTNVRWHSGAGSIRSHKRQMKKTWQIHQWAKEYVSAPGLGVQLFWIGQIMAGFLFPAEFNWRIYRLLKKFTVLGYN